jgi:hypothetical protein
MSRRGINRLAAMSEDIKYKPPVTVKAGEIQFIEACHPPLVAGDYEVGMSQLIKESKDDPVPWNSDPYASDVVFSVDAPRFTLSPAEIHSVYPPVNETGRFDNALPHVVFTRRTLPWERTLDGKPPEWGKAFPPWMGLLLLEEDELLDPKTGQRYEVKSLPILSTDTDSLLLPHPEKQNVLVPDLGQKGRGNKKWEKEKWQYENEKESCLAIDLPAELFEAIAPHYEDLPYLAHVRQVDTGNKEVLGINDRGWFSLVIGNRLPQADKSHRAFLVSLEGVQDRLTEDWTPDPGQMVRLAVLGTWAFTCEGSNDFKACMDLLNFDRIKPPNPDARKELPDSWLHLPYDSYDDNSLDAKDIVQGAYSRGYSAFNHVMRQGEKTVSWHRGPLVPLNYTKPSQVQEPVSCADELLRYDPDTGLFDVAYAAAWQIGRLLALQNQSFALALNRARRVLRAKAESLMRRDELKALNKELGLPEKDLIEDGLMENIANGAGEKLKNAVPK